MPAVATKLAQFLVAELCVLLVGSCRSAPTTDTGGSEVTVDRRAPATAYCPRGVVETAGFRKPSRATGEWSVIAVLANGSSAPCGVRGAPKVQLRDVEGAPMSFEYVVNGGDVRAATESARITLAPGGRAYVKVAEYRCDLGVATRAEAMSIVALGVDATSACPGGLRCDLGVQVRNLDPGRLVRRGRRLRSRPTRRGLPTTRATARRSGLPRREAECGCRIR